MSAKVGPVFTFRLPLGQLVPCPPSFTPLDVTLERC